jgi:glucose 1-dehydrogenase
MKKLSGQTAIISGGLGDIGRAIAEALAAEGASIALCGLQAADEAKDFLAGLRALGSRASYDRLDVTDAEATAAWVLQVERSMGVPSLIIPNAAQVTPETSRAITPRQWERELRVNLDGAFYFAQSAALRLVENGKAGRIVFIGSWAGHRPHPAIVAYSVSKAALRMLCQCMALEFAPEGILVNEVAPGYVDAGLSAQIYLGDSARREASRRVVPLKQLLEPRDVAMAVRFLCEPENRHMTGTVIVQDGGLSQMPPGVP